MRGPKPPPIALVAEERAQLEALARRHGTAQQLALRARLVLAAADGANNAQIARRWGVSVDTALDAAGERIVSTDELTGVQALERRHPGLPLAPGKVERREFEYIRHGTLTFILNRDVATGRVVAPSCGPTRTAADFVAHIRQTVATAPAATRWHFVVDNLNIHQSESLVRHVAEASGVTE